MHERQCFWGLTVEQIAAEVEAEDLTCKVRGERVEVYNASGKRHLGAIFPCRDGSRGHDLTGLYGDRLAARLAALSGPPPAALPETSSAPAETRTNARPGPCAACGAEVPPGQGALWFEPGPDDGGDVVGRTPAGWRVTHLDAATCARIQTEHRARRDADRAAAAAAAAARATTESLALATWQARTDALLKDIPDCTCTGYAWRADGVLTAVARTDAAGRSRLDHEGELLSAVALEVPADPALAGLSLSHANWRRVRATTGEVGYTHAFGNACVLYAPRAVVERAWRAWAEARGVDAAAAEGWLAVYGPYGSIHRDDSYDGQAGCAEWQAYAYAAGRYDAVAAEDARAEREHAARRAAEAEACAADLAAILAAPLDALMEQTRPDEVWSGATRHPFLAWQRRDGVMRLGARDVELGRRWWHDALRERMRAVTAECGARNEALRAAARSAAREARS